MNLPALHGNWVDLVIILVLAYFIYESWRRGFWLVIADFLSFTLSLLISLKAYKLIASLLVENFSLAKPTADAVGFLATALTSEMLLGYLLVLIITKLPKKLAGAKWSKYLGLGVGFAEGIVFTAFVLTLLINLPIKAEVKNDISNSKIGGLILKKTSGIEKIVNDVFGGAINESIMYKTVEPGQKETIPLKIETEALVVDEKAEAEMFRLTNEERAKVGVPALTWSPEIVPVARTYARDMWVRRYFSHYSPEGQDVGDRLRLAGIKYFYAGENLALAPTTAVAHNGLMNSPGHRANILDAQFHKVGIGVISNNYYGLMIVENFTD